MSMGVNCYSSNLETFADLIEQRYGFRRDKCLDMASQYMLSKKGEKLEAKKMDEYRDDLFGKIDSNEII